jgi:hypothetical protein
VATYAVDPHRPLRGDLKEHSMNGVLTPPGANAPRAAARIAAVTARVVLVLLAVAGCAPRRLQSSTATAGAQRIQSSAAKASFVVAAHRVCAAHLESVMAWLERPRSGNQWRRLAATSEGICGIIANTIQRLGALGPAPEPNAVAFAGYLKTLKARAIDGIGDRDAHRYGLRRCGAGLRDLARALAEAGWTQARTVATLTIAICPSTTHQQRRCVLHAGT